jgi:hypothetical protein
MPSESHGTHDQTPAEREEALVRRAASNAEVESAAGLGERLEAYYARQIEWSRKTFGPNARTILDYISSKEAEVERLREALERLVEAKALAGVRGIVAGWNGEGKPDGPYKRHPKSLGATLPKTNCGAVYELDDALQAARAFLTSSAKGPTHVE